MERHVAELDFAPGGVASLLQVTDLKNSPGPAKKDLRVAMRQVVDLFQDNYPELVARNVSAQIILISVFSPSINSTQISFECFEI